MISFVQKTFLITGAGAGIGYATAARLARSDARLALVDLDIKALHRVRDALAPGGADIACYQADVSDSAQCTQTVKEIARHFGDIDHLVHAAGVYPEAMVADMSDDDWQRLMHINLDGTFHICRAVIPYLSNKSSIVTLASMAGHRGSYAHAHYSASKGAVSSFSKSLALELAPNTRVNIVAPGIIETAMTASLLQQKGQVLLDNTPLKRFGTADEVAGTILFLCSDLASFISGETIHVNGGLYIV